MIGSEYYSDCHQASSLMAVGGAISYPTLNPSAILLIFAASVGKNSKESDLLFIHNLRDAPDASVALADDERNTFYHHHRSVQA